MTNPIIIKHGVFNHVWIEINLSTRRISFCYDLSEEVGFDFGFRFSLLSECRDDIQKIIKSLIESLGIEIMTVEDRRNFYTIVTNSRLDFDE